MPEKFLVDTIPHPPGQTSETKEVPSFKFKVLNCKVNAVQPKDFLDLSNLNIIAMHGETGHPVMLSFERASIDQNTLISTCFPEECGVVIIYVTLGCIPVGQTPYHVCSGFLM